MYSDIWHSNILVDRIWLPWLPYGYPWLPYGYPMLTPGYPMVTPGYPMVTLWLPHAYPLVTLWLPWLPLVTPRLPGYPWLPVLCHSPEFLFAIIHVPVPVTKITVQIILEPKRTI